MKNFLRTVAFFAASLVVGEIVRRLLMSRPGRSVADRFGHPELGTCDGAGAAAGEARKAVGLARTLMEAQSQTPPAAPVRTGPPWVRLALDASEMLLAAGGVLKTVADFVGEDEKLRRRIDRGR
jgi:hypothetical protein